MIHTLPHFSFLYNYIQFALYVSPLARSYSPHIYQ